MKPPRSHITITSSPIHRENQLTLSNRLHTFSHESMEKNNLRQTSTRSQHDADKIFAIARPWPDNTGSQTSPK